MGYILGVTAYYHYSSACLFKDDKLLFACEEEKFTGIKHDKSFPKKTLDYIYSNYNLTRDDIDVICYYENPKLKLGRVLNNSKKVFYKSPYYSIKSIYDYFENTSELNAELLKYCDNIYFSNHHKSHLYYSFFTSPFEEAAVVAIDGVGELDTLTFGVANKYGIKYFPLANYPHSLGMFYSAITHFLGFKETEGEYKIMDLAPYGNPDKYLNNVRKLISFNDEKLICNMKCFTWDRSDKTLYNKKLIKLLNLSPRLPKDKITQEHKDLAASVQKVYEEILFDILNFVSKKYTNKTKLCLGGITAYNGTANGKITNKTNFNNLWIPPAPSDSGSSIGACISYLVERQLIRHKIDLSPFLGPEYSKERIQNELRGIKHVRYDNYDELNNYIANQISNGKVIGWFKGRIEFGSRALGNRSILADPRHINVKTKINNRIKKREEFRPFSPMVIKEEQEKYFHINEDIPYMNQVVKLKHEYINKLSAITHIDYTCKVQTVYNDNSVYGLLKEFQKITSYPILLNTSFNIKDKTMVLTPKDAINMFYETDLDILVLEDCVITKTLRSS